MAKGSAPRGGKRSGARPTASRAPQKKAPTTRAAKKDAAPRAVEPLSVVGPLRLGAIPGATPGKWIDTWKERLPGAALELVPLSVADQRRALVDGDVDAAIVRLPVDATGLSVIPLYDEAPVVVVPVDSHLTAGDDLGIDDLAGEVVITPLDDVLGIEVPGAAAPRFAAPPTAGEAIETVAAGVGVVIVPMSLARAHHRKDVAFRVLRDGPASSVALAWVADRRTAAVDAFIGIVRGRTANSSRA